MNLEAVAKLVHDARLATLKKNLFIEAMPAKVNEGVMFRSDYYGTPIDHELPGYRKTEFQMIVRSAKYKDGRDLAVAISNLLTFGEKQVSGMAFQFLRPIHEPVSYPLSQGDLLEFSVNFETAYAIVSE